MSGSRQGRQPPLTQRELLVQAVYPPPRYVWADDTREAALAAAVAQVEFEEAKQAWQQLEYFVLPDERRKLRRRFEGSELRHQEWLLDARLAAARKRKEDAATLFRDVTRVHQRLTQRDRLAQQDAERKQEDLERQRAQREADQRHSRLASLFDRVAGGSRHD